jgi:uncharacterized membrane protein
LQGKLLWVTKIRAANLLHLLLGPAIRRQQGVPQYQVNLLIHQLLQELRLIILLIVQLLIHLILWLQILTMLRLLPLMLYHQRNTLRQILPHLTMVKCRSLANLQTIIRLDINIHLKLRPVKHHNPYQESQKNTAEPTLPQLNLEPNLAAALSYMFWVVSGAYFLFTERENQFVRFHAMQSIVFGAAWIMFYFVSSFFLIIISSILSLIGIPAVWKLFGLLVNGIYLIWFGIWIMLMYKAYNKETFSLPVLGDIASKQLKHWNKQL